MMKDVATTGLSVSKKTKVIAVTVVVTWALNLILNNILIRLIGNQGAALSKMLSMMVFFALTLYFAQKVYPIPYELKRIALLLMVGAFLYGISLLINPLNTIPRLATKSILIVLYPFILHVFNFYEAVELDRIRGGWDKWLNFGELTENMKRLIKK